MSSTASASFPRCQRLQEWIRPGAVELVQRELELEAHSFPRAVVGQVGQCAAETVACLLGTAEQSLDSSARAGQTGEESGLVVRHEAQRLEQGRATVGVVAG